MALKGQIQRTKQATSPNSEPKKTPSIRQRNSNTLSEQELAARKKALQGK
jgi:hypothetical protein